MFWTKKTTKESVPVEGVEIEKPVDNYDLLAEVAIHTMPTRYKEMHVDGEQAKKTGMLILFGGGLFLVAAVIGVSWILLVPKNNKKPVAQVKIENAVNTATTSEADYTAIAETLVTSPLVATATDAMSSSSVTGIESDISNINDQVTSSSLPIVVANDADGDGLLDPEEELLGTSKNNKDSDADTFADLAEILKGYNPAGSGKLIDNPAIAQYSNNIFSLIYPRSWPFKAQDNGSILFTTPENQMLSISVNENLSNESIEDWYKGQFRVSSINADQLITQDNTPGVVGWVGIKSSDKLTYYLMNNTKKYIIAINYNLGPSNTVNFENLIKMAVQTFRFK